MNKSALIKASILLLAATGVLGFMALSQIYPVHSKKAGYRNDPVPRDWKTYTNEQYGFSFRYPPAFAQLGRASEIKGISGDLKAIELNFFDKRSNSELLAAYHFAPDGAGLYQYALSEYLSNKSSYEKGSRELKVGGNSAIETISKMSINGKGIPLHPALRLVVVNLLDNEKTGGIELQFRTPMPGADKRAAAFQLLLSTFRFNTVR